MRGNEDMDSVFYGVETYLEEDGVDDWGDQNLYRPVIRVILYILVHVLECR